MCVYVFKRLKGMFELLFVELRFCSDYWRQILEISVYSADLLISNLRLTTWTTRIYKIVPPSSRVYGNKFVVCVFRSTQQSV